MWEYKRTNKLHQGLTVYKAYCFGEFSHYCYKEPAFQLQTKRVWKNGKLGVTHKEVRKGSKFTPIHRVRIKENSEKYWLSHDELAEEFESRKSKVQSA